MGMPIDSGFSLMTESHRITSWHKGAALSFTVVYTVRCFFHCSQVHLCGGMWPNTWTIASNSGALWSWTWLDTNLCDQSELTGYKTVDEVKQFQTSHRHFLHYQLCFYVVVVKNPVKCSLMFCDYLIYIFFNEETSVYLSWAILWLRLLSFLN